MLLAFFTVFFLGCTTLNPLIPKTTFESGYTEIIELEKQYNLTNMNEIETYTIYLDNFKSKLDPTTRDISALNQFLEFRINLLTAQKNILFAEHELGLGINCSEQQNALEGFAYLKDANKNLELTVVSLNKFRSIYPEYVAKTKITDQTTTDLQTIILESTKALNDFRTEYNALCG